MSNLKLNQTLFAVGVAERKWLELHAEGYAMQHIAFSNKCRTGRIEPWGRVTWASEQDPTQFKLNTNGSVAVSAVTRLSKDMSACPQACKVQLLGKGGVLTYGNYHGEPFWVEWAPLPARAL